MKKKILLLLCVLLVFSVLPVVGVSAEDYTIVINPGHSSQPVQGTEPIAPVSSTMKAKGVYGATGQFSKIPEYKTTVSVGLELKKKLEDLGYKVIMTKSTVPEALSNIERAQVGNNNKANLVISIHADSSSSSSVSGATMLLPAQASYTAPFYERSKECGQIILKQYTSETGIKSRGLSYRSDITGFNWSTVPTVLIEMGFLSNRSDDAYVSNTANHPAIAQAIANGIDQCFPHDNSSFRDITNSWAKSEIQDFAAKGYINGYGNGLFRPENTITRAEFVTIFNKYFSLTNSKGVAFNDTKGHWAEKAIDIAVTNGVCQGISSTIFSPDTPITREEAAKMVANYLKIADTNIDKLQKFTDNAKVSSWARAEMEGTIEAGYFNGYPDNTLRPQGNITRAETVVVMGRLKH